MKTIETVLKQELNQLRKVIENAKKRLENSPKGHLRIRKDGNSIEYYYKSPECEKHNGRYLKKREQSIARKIAQRDYDIHLLQNAEDRAKAIEKFLGKYEETNLGRVYQNLTPYRRELLGMAILSDEAYVKQWQEVSYTGKAFLENTQEIITERGERVRSKSEKIIADKLYQLGIPYRYEYPIVLDGNFKTYPDFTILKMPQREEVYLEHFGMMDDSGYVEKVINKLDTYARNGIFIGVNLFFTYESGKRTLNTRNIDQMIRKIFVVEKKK